MKLLETIPIIKALAKKKKITGMSGRMISGEAFKYTVSPTEMASIPIRYGRDFPIIIEPVLTGVERSTSPLCSIRSFIILIMKNCDVK